MQPPYFKGLDILRFLAAAIVVLSHSHYHLNDLHIAWHDNAHIMYAGREAVWFFFVLSGFLLTRIGIREQLAVGKFKIKRFYLRRIGRIWPLYYLSLALSFLFAFVLIPVFYPGFNVQFPLVQGLVSTIFLFPNYLTVNSLTNIGSVNNLWSIGVEEAFYLFFPLLLVIAGKRRNHLLVFIAAMVFWILILQGVYFSWIAVSAPIGKFILSYHFQYLLTGCIFAVVWTKSEENKARRKRFDIVIAVLGFATGFVFFKNILLPIWLTHLSTATFFGTIIWFTASAGNKPFNRNPLVYFGKISYGIYIYHPFVSYFYRFLINRWNVASQLVKGYPAVYFLAVLASTILIAHFSYRFFEKRFLRSGRTDDDKAI